MIDPIFVVACCAGFGLTLSYFTLGHSRVPPAQLMLDDDDEVDDVKDETKSDRPRTNPGTRRRRVLLVTAHPDDECMFFGPTILHFTEKENANVYLLCLSAGDYNGQGDTRRLELWKSCAVLGIVCENIMLYRCDGLPDDPTIAWPTVRTANIINQHIHALDINMVITFDGYGVSGHINHSSLHYAIEYLVKEYLLPPKCEAFSLDTVNIFRKYSSLLDVPLSYLFSSFAFTLDYQQYLKLRTAMKSHASQYVWFRKLYMIFSRYTLINTLTRISED